MENVKTYFSKNSEQVFALTLLLTIVAINYFFPFKLVFLNVYYFPSFFMPAFTDLDLWMNILAWSSFLILTGVVGGRLIHGLKIELEEAEKNEERLKSHARPLEQLKESTIIGPSISVKGELTGEGDLTVQGQVEGQIDLKKSHVTIGRTGCINADVYGKFTTIEGEVQGNLFGEEKIVLRQSAVVRGDMRAPRINLEEGAKFKGNIDMDFKDGEKQPTLKEVPLAAMGGRLGQRVSKSPAGRSPVPPLLDLPAS